MSRGKKEDAQETTHHEPVTGVLPTAWLSLQPKHKQNIIILEELIQRGLEKIEVSQRETAK